MTDEVPEPLPPERTPCPAWCDRTQCQEADPADCYHQRVTLLPVVLRHVEPLPSGNVTARPEAVEASVAVFTSALDETDEIWVAVEMGEYGRGITVTRESALRLHRALGECIATSA